MKIPLFQSQEMMMVRVGEVVEWLQSVFRTPQTPYPDDTGLKVKIRFTTELLRLSRDIMSLQYASNELFVIFGAMLLLMKEFSLSESVSTPLSMHWCGLLKRAVSKSEKFVRGEGAEAVDQLVEVCLESMKTACLIRMNKQVQEFLSQFGALKNGDISEEVSNAFINLVFKDMDFARRKVDFDSAANELILTKSVPDGQHVKLASMKQVAPEELLRKKDEFIMDIFLLNLLFRSSKKHHERMALDIIIRNFDQRSRLKTQLQGTELLVEEVFRDKYKQIKMLHKRLRIIIKDLKHLSEMMSVSKANHQEKFEKLQIVFSHICEELQKTLDLSESEPVRIKSQRIARNVGIQELLFDFLEWRFVWVIEGNRIPKRFNQTPGNTAKPALKHNIKEEALGLYSDAISALYAFAFNNLENQVIAFSKIELLLRLMDNKVGLSRLLGQAIASQRATQSSRTIIEYVFADLMAHSIDFTARPHDLNMLNYLIVGEDGVYFTNNQTEIFKTIITYDPFKEKYHSAANKKDLYFAEFETENHAELKFFCVLLALIVRCAIQNRYVMTQARLLFPLQELTRRLFSSDLNPKLSKSLLNYLFFVFCMETQDGLKREMQLNDMAELLRKVFIPKISRLEELIPFLPDICVKGKYSPVPYKAQFENVLSGRGKVDSIKSLLFGSKEVPREKDTSGKLTEEQVSVLKYWKATFMFKPWKTGHATGLIALFIDFLTEIQTHNVVCSEELWHQLECMRILLTSLIQSLQNLQQAHPELIFTYLISRLEAVIGAYPHQNGNVSMDSEEAGEHEALKLLARSIQTYIQFANLTLPEFLTSLSPEIVCIKKDMIAALKDVLGKEVTYYQLETALNSVSKTDLTISREDLWRALQENFEKSESQEYEDRLCPASEELQHFLKTSYSRLTHDTENSELQELVDKIKVTIIEPSLAKGDLQILRGLNTNLEKAFREPRHKVYLIRMFQYMVQPTESGKDPDPVQIRVLKQIVNESEITETAAALIYTGNDPGLIEETFKLLNTLLKYDPLDTKAKLLEKLQASGIAFQFCSFIRNNLRECERRIEAIAEDRKINKNMYRKAKYRPVKGEERLAEANDVGREESTLLTKRVLHFLKLCSERCYQGFQNFFREQTDVGDKVSIDLVSEVSVLLINLQRSDDVKEKYVHTEARLTAHYALNILINFCSGPCAANQSLVGPRRNLYSFINFLTRDYIDFCDEKNYFIGLFELAVSLLLTLLEGSTASEVSKVMLQELDFPKLIQHATEIYEKLIHGRQVLIYQESAGTDFAFLKPFELRGRQVTEAQKRVIETGYNINILIRKLNDLHPNEKVLSLIFSDSPRFLYKNETLRSSFAWLEENEAQTEENRRLVYQLRSFWSRKRPPLVSMKLAAFRFFSGNIATVEIDHNHTLVKEVFHVPSKCKFLSDRSREAVVTKVTRTTQQEKIDDFFRRSGQYEHEMIHRQKLARYPILHLVCRMWEYYATYSFYLVLVVNITILFSVKHDGGNTGNWVWDTDNIDTLVFVQTIGFIQMILSVLILVGYMVEYSPVIIYKHSERKRLGNNQQFYGDKWTSVKGTMIMQEVLVRSKTSVLDLLMQLPMSYKVLALLKEKQFIYYALYCIISIIAWVHFLWYPILLLDIVKRREDLVNVLKSVTLNYKSLILTLVMGIIIIFLFSIVAFNFLSQYYVNADSTLLGGFSVYPEKLNYGSANVAPTYCDNLMDCFFSTLIQGVRPGGGIGDNLLAPDYYDTHFWPLFFFEILYFILVAFVLLNIIFGIIIDTFAELRDERKEMLFDIENTCFICGLDKFEFEVRRLPWKTHINMDHNVYAYLAYIIYIKHKPEQDCNGIELYVKEQIKAKETGFFPEDSLALQAEKTMEVDEEKQEKNECLEVIRKIRERTIHKR